MNKGDENTKSLSADITQFQNILINRVSHILQAGASQRYDEVSSEHRRIGNISGARTKTFLAVYVNNK